jgi:hypothetical protein
VSDQGRVQVEAGDLEPVAGQLERQMAGSAADLQDLCAGGATAAISAAMRSTSEPSRSRLMVS